MAFTTYVKTPNATGDYTFDIIAYEDSTKTKKMFEKNVVNPNAKI